MGSSSKLPGSSSRDLASRLVANLLDAPSPILGIKSQVATPLLDDKNAAPDIYWTDVLESVKDYRAQTLFCEEFGWPILCIEPRALGPRPTPIHLTLDEAREFFSSPRSVLDPGWALDAIAGIRLSRAAKISPYSPSDALGFYRAGLTDFLGVRLAAGLAGATATTRYKFELSTKITGVNAYWTQAAVLRRGNFFGYPTFPVTGSLPAGNYCFGAGKTGASATYDMTTYFDIPAVDKGYIDV